MSRAAIVSAMAVVAVVEAVDAIEGSSQLGLSAAATAALPVAGEGSCCIPASLSLCCS